MGTQSVLKEVVGNLQALAALNADVLRQLGGIFGAHAEEQAPEQGDLVRCVRRIRTARHRHRVQFEVLHIRLQAAATRKLVVHLGARNCVRVRAVPLVQRHRSRVAHLMALVSRGLLSQQLIGKWPPISHDLTIKNSIVFLHSRRVEIKWHARVVSRCHLFTRAGGPHAVDSSGLSITRPLRALEMVGNRIILIKLSFKYSADLNVLFNFYLLLDPALKFRN